jgi:Superinfection immunity protein
MDFLIIVIAILGGCFYFLPTVISSIRHSEHSSGIFWVNCLFGWTVLGWIAALIWAVTEKVEERVTTSLPLSAEQQATDFDCKKNAGLFAIGFAIMSLYAWFFKR